MYFRRAKPVDIPGIVRLVESAYRGDESRQGWTNEADLLDGQRTDVVGVASAMAASYCIVLLAEIDASVVACCQVESRPERRAYLGMFAVQPGMQGRGIGRNLAEQAEQLAHREWGATELRLIVLRQLENLIAWYERLGYRLTGETVPFPYGDQRFGIPKRSDLDFLVMAKPL